MRAVYRPISNLVALWHLHHRLLHTHHLRLDHEVGGDWRLVTSTGDPWQPSRRHPTRTPTVAAAAYGIAPLPDAAQNHWGGDPLRTADLPAGRPVAAPLPADNENAASPAAAIPSPDLPVGRSVAAPLPADAERAARLEGDHPHDTTDLAPGPAAVAGVRSVSLDPDDSGAGDDSRPASRRPLATVRPT